MKITQSNFNNFVQTLAEKQHIKVILLYGNEEAIILEYTHTIKEILKTYSFQNIDNENPNYLQELGNEMFTDSMFGENKILCIHNFRKLDGKKITDILSKIDTTCHHILILTQTTTLDANNSIRKLCETTSHFASIGIYAEGEATIKTIAKNLMESLHMHYEPNVLDILAQMFTNNSSVMKQEIHKLQTYLLSSPQIITQEIIRKVLDSNQQENIFEIPAYLLEKNLKKTLDILQNAQLNDIHPTMVFTGISNYIKKLYFIKKALLQPQPENIEILLKKNGIFFQQVGIVKKHLNNYSVAQIINIIEKLNTLETQTRNTTTFAYNSIKNFAVNLCSAC